MSMKLAQQFLFIYLFELYVTTLPVTQTMHSPIVGRLVNIELERI
jgi:hypothetical protein